MSRRLGLARCGAAGLASAAALAMADATTDGSVGPRQSLSGAFTIPQSLGALRGSNLFHSFARFGIDPGESATFTTTSGAIRNVIARVTGGQASVIHGLLKLEAAAGSPDFYLVNPAGVVMGAGAQIDVPAGLHISTAQRLAFGDGFVWDTDRPSVSALTVAPPQAFGFVGPRAAVALNNLDPNGVPGAGPQVQLKPGGSFEIAAGAIQFDGASVAVSEGGRITLQAGGELAVRASLISSATSTDRAGGAIVIEAASLVMEHSGETRGIRSETHGPAAASNVTIAVAGPMSLFDSDIVSQSRSTGSAGATSVQAGALTIDGAGAARGLFNSALRESSGPDNRGHVQVNVAGATVLTHGGQISSSTFSDKPAGAVEVQTGSLVIDRSGDQATGIYSIAGRGSDSNAGSIRLRVADELRLLRGGEISSNTRSGNAGAIDVQARAVNINGDGVAISTGIFSQALPGSTGAGGQITLVADDELNVVNGGSIASSTFSLGAGGSIAVSAGSLTIDRQGSELVTSIASRARVGSTGDAGQISLNVRGQLAVLNQGTISSNTNSVGSAGSIDIQAQSIVIDRRGANAVTGVFSDALSDASGSRNVGHIHVKAQGALSLLDGGQISTSTTSEKPAGSVEIEAGSLTVDRGSGRATGIFSIAGRGSSNDAGDITVDVADHLAVLRAGEISSNTRSGRGGTIDVHARTITVDGEGSRITASAGEGSSGQTGSLRVVADERIVVSNQGVLSIRNAATVGASTRALAQAPSELPTLAVQAPDIALASGGEISAAATGNVAASHVDIAFGDRLTLRDAAITTTAVDGNGGGIRIHGGGVALLRNSQVATSVLGGSNGNGGDIEVEAAAVALDTGFIQANTAVPLAFGGNVRVDSGVLVSSGSALSRGGDAALDFERGVFGLNAIQAAAPQGLSGTVEVTAPALDVAGALSRLSTELIDPAAVRKDLCRLSAGSSLSWIGRGGLRANAATPMRPERVASHGEGAGPKHEASASALRLPASYACLDSKD